MGVGEATAVWLVSGELTGEFSQNNKYLTDAVTEVSSRYTTKFHKFYISTIAVLTTLQQYRRRYKTCRSSKPKIAAGKQKKYSKERFSMWRPFSTLNLGD